jgi:hypothetical protein
MLKINLPISKEAIVEFSQKHNLYRISDLDIFVDTVDKLNMVTSISDRILPLKSYLDLVRKLQQDEQKPICMDDEFLASCVLLDLEISIFSAVYCLKGMANDFKETKMGREVIDPLEPTPMADLRHKLSKPNEIRGAVESNTIYTSYNRLLRRMHLHESANDILIQLSQGIPKQEIMRNFSLTLTDFDLVMRISKYDHTRMQNQKRLEGEQRLKLNNDNLIDLKEYAENQGIININQALNDVLEQFFIQQKVRQQKNIAQKERV